VITLNEVTNGDTEIQANNKITIDVTDEYKLTPQLLLNYTA
jgi:hypothetical protein